MNTPQRVKVEGDLFHGRIPDGAVYIGRPAPGLPGSSFANPFTVRDYEPAEAVRRYRERMLSTPQLLAAARRELAGRDLACWCPLGLPCHADVLLDLANQVEE